MASANRRNDNYREVLFRVQRVWGESPFYQAKLRGPAPDRLLFRPDDPYTPDINVARALIAGRLVIGDESIDCEGELHRIWDLACGEGAARAFLHEFGWLRHLDALGPSATEPARQLTEAWLDRFEKWSAEAWEPYFVAERLMQLCAHHSLILSGADALWRSRVLTSMARQTRHLANTAHRGATGFERLMTALGLCVVGHCLPGCEPQAARGLEMARREIRLQLRADGGHISRNPSRQLKLAVRLLIALRAVELRGLQSPGFLRHTMLRAGAMVSFFRSGDGQLAIFNGGYEDDPRAILAIEKALDTDGAPAGFARHSGYHKLSSGRGLIILDAGGSDISSAFKSAGSFHFSSGRSRIVVNCGNGAHRSAQWRDALLAREAHSTMSFDPGEGRAPAFGDVSHKRGEDSHGLLVEMEGRLLTHDGADGSYHRRFFLAAGGADLRGEERLEGLPDHLTSRAVWRFHLHPGVRASLARDGRSVLLLLPNKEGWRFKSNASELGLEKSVYCGGGDTPAAAEQIVLRAGAVFADDRGDVLAKWALRRLDAAS